MANIKLCAFLCCLTPSNFILKNHPTDAFIRDNNSGDLVLYPAQTKNEVMRRITGLFYSDTLIVDNSGNSMSGIDFSSSMILLWGEEVKFYNVENVFDESEQFIGAYQVVSLPEGLCILKFKDKRSKTVKLIVTGKR